MSCVAWRHQRRSAFRCLFCIGCEMLATYAITTQLRTTKARLASTTEAEHKVECRLLLDVVVLKGATILELLASEDETLLVRGDALLVLDLGLDGLNGVGAFHLEGDGLPGEGLHKDLHF